MPSRIENSTLCVYEAAYYGIPCIATDRGGTAELIAPEHRKEVLTEPLPHLLAQKIEEAISKGGFIPKPSFNNDRNLAAWLKLHAAMGAQLRDASTKRQKKGASRQITISICLVFRDNQEYLEEFITRINDTALAAETQLVLVNDDTAGKGSDGWLEKIRQQWRGSCTVIEGEGAGEQRAQNLAASKATGDLLVFFEYRTLLRAAALELLMRAASNSDAAVFGCFYDRYRNREDMEKEDGRRRAATPEDFSNAFFSTDFSSPVIAIRKNVFDDLGGFREDYKIAGSFAELFAMASLRNLGVETIPEPIAWVVESYRNTGGINYAAEPYRSIRPFLENAPHCYKRILMASRSTTATAYAGSMVTIEKKARDVAGEAGSSPKMRNFGWSIYWWQLRLVGKIIDFELRFFKLLLRVKQSILRR